MSLAARALLHQSAGVSDAAQTCQPCARRETLFTPAQALYFLIFMLLSQSLTPLSHSFLACDEVVEKSGCPGNDSFLDSKLLTFWSFPERQNSLVVSEIEGFPPNVVFSL